MIKKLYRRILKPSSSSHPKRGSIQEQASQGLASAQYTLASWYEDGEHGLPCNLMLAYRWYQRAAEQGHAESLDRIVFLKAIIRAVDVPNVEK